MKRMVWISIQSTDMDKVINVTIVAELSARLLDSLMASSRSPLAEVL